MIKTLYVKGDEADRCTESFRSSVPITITGIDAADERRVCTGAITVRGLCRSLLVALKRSV